MTPRMPFGGWVARYEGRHTPATAPKKAAPKKAAPKKAAPKKAAPKKASPKKAAPKKPRRPYHPGPWRVDSTGRWRDARGHYAPRKRLGTASGMPPISELAGTREDVGEALRHYARGVPLGGPPYMVVVRSEGWGHAPPGDEGWRSISIAADLRSALQQGSSALLVTLEARGARYHDADAPIEQVAIRPIGHATGAGLGGARAPKKPALKKPKKPAPKKPSRERGK